MEPHTVYLILTLIIAGSEPDITTRLPMPDLHECMVQVAERLRAKEPKEIEVRGKKLEVAGVMAGCARAIGFESSAQFDSGLRDLSSRFR